MSNYTAVRDSSGHYEIYEQQPRNNEPMPPGCILLGLYFFMLYLQWNCLPLPFGILTIIVGCVMIRDGYKISGWFTLINGILGVIICAAYWILRLTGQLDAVISAL